MFAHQQCNLCQKVFVDNDHRDSDHFCVVSMWNYELDGLPGECEYDFSLFRTLKSPFSIKAFTSLANKQCRKLQEQVLSPKDLLEKTVSILENTAVTCFPKSKSKEKQDRAKRFNLTGFNEYVKPYKEEMHRTYRLWRNEKGTLLEQYYWHAFQNANKCYRLRLNALKRSQMQVVCDKVNSQNCHKAIKEKPMKIVPPKTILFLVKCNN